MHCTIFHPEHAFQTAAHHRLCQSLECAELITHSHWRRALTLSHVSFFLHPKLLGLKVEALYPQCGCIYCEPS
ncbi:hypothetical protein DM02DRAFT_242959 [Periconia macrospinosa]|uniref:Uncharacterized protein n=1 Tax=Periconia macrospinosa TaxID=97972 RepID=A0A2V1D5B6_9PLEO|nr:hypothetical protein DM02DRAFT_242959 [Periconia macrospinosa]